MSETVWSSGLHTEIAFWRGQMEDIRDKKDPSLAWRMAPREIEQRYMALVREDRRDSAAIIDVGSGPFTHQGSLWKGQAANLICVDPLTNEYRDLCQEFGILPPIPSIACRAEDLSLLFAPGAFDLVTSTNALDHSIDPLAAISEMFKICRPGGSVFIELCENVGVQEKYFGLHQHNFTIENDELIIWRPDGYRERISRRFSNLIKAEVTDRNHPWRKTDWGGSFISAHYVKVQ